MYKFNGDGLPYIISEFTSLIRQGKIESSKRDTSRRKNLRQLLNTARAGLSGFFVEELSKKHGKRDGENSKGLLF